MLHFESDYMEGCCPEILQRFADINLEKNTGYGEDRFCRAAREKIRIACGCEKAEVRFLAGGTQTNAVVLSSLLRSYEGVLAAETAHIATHEAGAIEYTGHKVLTLPQKEGKISAEAVKSYMLRFLSEEAVEHLVQPGAVYISHPTEYGTLYSRQELEALRKVCDEYGLKLYMDGARLGYGLVAHGANVTLHDVARLMDVFYIGGTKVGALLGEAVVIPDPKLLPHFFTSIKQHGALLAKGWAAGLQFDTLFTEGLYTRAAHRAIHTADILRTGLTEKGYKFFIDSPTNQLFPIMENEKMNALRAHVGLTVWEPYDETHTVVRFVTSWATAEEDVHALLALL